MLVDEFTLSEEEERRLMEAMSEPDGVALTSSELASRTSIPVMKVRSALRMARYKNLRREALMDQMDDNLAEVIATLINRAKSDTSEAHNDRRLYLLMTKMYEDRRKIEHGGHVNSEVEFTINLGHKQIPDGGNVEKTLPVSEASGIRRLPPAVYDGGSIDESGQDVCMSGLDTGTDDSDT